jgi:hypothetical protein
MFQSFDAAIRGKWHGERAAQQEPGRKRNRQSARVAHLKSGNIPIAFARSEAWELRSRGAGHNENRDDLSRESHPQIMRLRRWRAY